MDVPRGNCLHLLPVCAQRAEGGGLGHYGSEALSRFLPSWQDRGPDQPSGLTEDSQSSPWLMWKEGLPLPSVLCTLGESPGHKAGALLHQLHGTHPRISRTGYTNLRITSFGLYKLQSSDKSQALD
jgi:hypothetical protein